MAITDDTAGPKAALRKAAHAAREAAFGKRAATGAVAKATSHLLSAIGDRRGAVVAGYMPIRSEMDPLPAMTVLARTARLCVPVIQGAGRPLVFREWTPDAAMRDGPFGARVPRTGAVLRPSVLIVPLVGFDARANRLGHGGGFYDRTLADLRARGPVLALGLAYAAQAFPALPVAPTDQPLDAVVTEAGIVAPRD